MEEEEFAPHAILCRTSCINKSREENLSILCEQVGCSHVDKAENDLVEELSLWNEKLVERVFQDEEEDWKEESCHEHVISKSCLRHEVNGLVVVDAVLLDLGGCHVLSLSAVWASEGVKLAYLSHDHLVPKDAKHDGNCKHEWSSNSVRSDCILPETRFLFNWKLHLIDGLSVCFLWIASSFLLEFLEHFLFDNLTSCRNRYGSHRIDEDRHSVEHDLTKNGFSPNVQHHQPDQQRCDEDDQPKSLRALEVDVVHPKSVECLGQRERILYHIFLSEFRHFDSFQALNLIPCNLFALQL